MSDTVTPISLDEIPSLTTVQISAIHAAVKFLAARDDGAVTLDGMGFNKFDSPIGQRLADQLSLTESEAVDALVMVKKYKKQLPNDLISLINGTLSRIPRAMVEIIPGGLRLSKGDSFMATEPTEYGMPFESWRTHQVDPILAILDTDKKFCALTAPTGSGKSVIAAALAKATERSALILTKNKSLQYQYRDTIPFVRSVEGMNNFNCILPDFTDLTVGEAPCRHDFKCPQKAECGYYAQRDAAARAQVTVTNYDYALAAMKGDQSPVTSGRHWLIADEGQFLDEQITKVWTIDISPRQKARLGDYRHLGYDHEKWRQWAVEKYREWMPEYNAAIGEMGDIQEAMGDDPESAVYAIDSDAYREASRKLASMKSTKDLLERLQSIDNEWIIYLTDTIATFRPLWVKEQSGIFLAQGRKVLLMSATLPKGDVLAELMGLDRNDIFEYEVPSVFPVEHRPIYVRPYGKMSHATWQDEVYKLIPPINKILDAHHDKKVLIHCHSNALRDMLYKLIDRRHQHRIMLHDTATRASALRTFTDTKQGKVMLSPSMESGIDVPDLSVIVIPRCLPTNVQAVTSDGPKIVDDLHLGDTVFALKPDGEMIETKIRAILRKPYSGDLIRAKSQSMDIPMTPDHRVLIKSVKQRYGNYMKLDYLQADDPRLFNTAYVIPTSGMWKGTPYIDNKFDLEPFIKPDDILVLHPNNRFARLRHMLRFPIKYDGNSRTWKFTYADVLKHGYTIEEIEHITDSTIRHKGAVAQFETPIKIDLNDMAELIGWYISEGCVYKGSESNFGICQSERVHPENHARIRALCDKIGVHASTYPQVTRVYSSLLRRAIHTLCPGRALDKRLYAKQLPLTALRRLLYAAIAGDGSRRSIDSYIYYTVSYGLACDISEIAIKCGYSPVIGSRKRKKGQAFSTRTAYTVCIHNTKHRSLKPYMRKVEQYDGDVWCITTDEGNFLACNDNKYFFTGNCLWPSLADPWVKKRADVWPEWYTWQTVANMTQAIGRAPRDETHHACSYILDSNFFMLWRKGGYMFPDYIKQAIQWP